MCGVGPGDLAADLGDFAGVSSFFTGVGAFAGVAAFFAGVAAFFAGDLAGVAAFFAGDLATIPSPFLSPRGDLGALSFASAPPTDLTAPSTAPVSFATSRYLNTMRSDSAEGKTTSSPSLSSTPAAPAMDAPFSTTGLVLLMFFRTTCVFGESCMERVVS